MGGEALPNDASNIFGGGEGFLEFGPGVVEVAIIQGLDDLGFDDLFDGGEVFDHAVAIDFAKQGDEEFVVVTVTRKAAGGSKGELVFDFTEFGEPIAMAC